LKPVLHDLLIRDIVLLNRQGGGDKFRLKPKHRKGRRGKDDGDELF
jgi:hypothetical protein